MLKVSDSGERRKSAGLDPSLCSRLSRDTQSVAPSAEPAPKFCSLRERSKSVHGGWKCFSGRPRGHPDAGKHSGVGEGHLCCIPLLGDAALRSTS